MADQSSNQLCGPEMALSVAVDLTPDGYAYTQTVRVGPDVAVPLDPDRAARWAAALFDVAARADMEAAVFRQLTAQVGMDVVMAIRMLRDWRDALPPLDLIGLEPLRAQPLLGDDAVGRVQVRLLTVPGSWTWTAEQARLHAAQVLAARAQPELFNTYRRYLGRAAELTDTEARMWVSRLPETEDKQR